MSEWKECKLGNVCVQVLTGGTPLTKKTEYYVKGKIPWLRTKEVNFCKIYNTENYISELGLANSSAKLVPVNSVIVAMYGQGDTAGRVAINKIPLATNQACCNLVIDNGVADYQFIYYLLKNSYFELVQRKTGSAQPNLNTQLIKDFDISPPPLPEQRSIASILSSLDDKIDLLHRQNKTLEALAQTLFRQWFVEEADESWEETKIENILRTELGGTPSTAKPEYWNGNIPWINSGEINKFRISEATKYITELGLQKSNTKILPKGTTVIAITGATLGQISLLEIDACANQSVVGIIPNDDFSKEFVFLWIKLKIKEIIANQTGGAQQHINKNDVNETSIIVPPKNLMNRIPILKNYFDKISSNIQQLRTLTRLRDTLLPKLMSGEVRLEMEE